MTLEENNLESQTSVEESKTLFSVRNLAFAFAAVLLVAGGAASYIYREKLFGSKGPDAVTSTATPGPVNLVTNPPATGSSANPTTSSPATDNSAEPASSPPANPPAPATGGTAEKQNGATTPTVGNKPKKIVPKEGPPPPIINLDNNEKPEKTVSQVKDDLVGLLKLK